MAGRQSSVDQAALMVVVDRPANLLEEPQPGDRVEPMPVAVRVDREIAGGLRLALRRPGGGWRLVQGLQGDRFERAGDQVIGRARWQALRRRLAFIPFAGVVELRLDLGPEPCVAATRGVEEPPAPLGVHGPGQLGNHRDRFMLRGVHRCRCSRIQVLNHARTEPREGHPTRRPIVKEYGAGLNPAPVAIGILEEHLPRRGRGQ